MRRALRAILWLFVGVVGFVGLTCAEAHWEIRQLVPTLPPDAALTALAGEPDGPVRLLAINTATQGLMHPAFWLEWADGRAFLIDTGMDREGAAAFGRTIELLLDAGPIEAWGSPGAQIGADAARIAGVAFTHLHSDHTGGLASICAEHPEPLRVFQTPWQAERGNYTTSPGRADVEDAACAQSERLESETSLYAVPGFPGLRAMPAAGHTPGSTIYFARVGSKTWVFSGDVTNRKDALLENRPKGRIYSWFVTPEAPETLETLRVWLAELDARPDTSVVVAHDLDALKTSGIEAWDGTLR